MTTKGPPRPPRPCPPQTPKRKTSTTSRTDVRTRPEQRERRNRKEGERGRSDEVGGIVRIRFGMGPPEKQKNEYQRILGKSYQEWETVSITCFTIT